MKLAPPKLIAVLCLAAAMWTTPAAFAASAHLHAAATKPSLALTGAKGYRLAVSGSGWGSGKLITFALRQRFTVVGLELTSTHSGTFLIGINHIDLCNGETFTARDLKGDKAQIQGPGLGCPVRPHPPVPTLKVLKGGVFAAAVHTVDLPSRPASVTMLLADAVRIWQEGSGKPAFLPKAPEAYFALIGRGTTPPRACPEVECSAGFFSIWAGMKVGQTGIVLNPRCYPKCKIFSREIPVTITARKK